MTEEQPKTKKTRYLCLTCGLAISSSREGLTIKCDECLVPLQISPRNKREAEETIRKMRQLIEELKTKGEALEADREALTEKIMNLEDSQ